MAAPARITRGLLTDSSRPIAFRFDGREMIGLAGDTLASALLANGHRIVGRSFKYHRPRGIVTAGPEEPCALVDVIGSRGREPNQLATMVSLRAGLVAESQNRWPSLRFDALAVNSLLSRFLPAGFYYKTFMAPGWAWERLYEPMIRRAAGLGRLEAIVGQHADPAETVHDHADVLVVGAGVAGLSAAYRLGISGLRVLLLEQDVTLGGGSLLDDRWTEWRKGVTDALASMSNVRCLTRTTVLGAYGHGVYGALETFAPERAFEPDAPEERLRIIRAKRVVLATGANERLIAFPGNDLPGVMLAGAAHSYLTRYGVAVARRPVFFLNSDEAYESLFALRSAGVQCEHVVDTRPSSFATDRAREIGVQVHSDAMIQRVTGWNDVRRVRVARKDGRFLRWLDADALLISGGFSPATSLATQLGSTLSWNESIAAFVPNLPLTLGRVVGAAAGVSGLAAAEHDANLAAREVIADLGRAVSAELLDIPVPKDAERASLEAMWEVRGRGKAFVDLQNDVTAEDVRLAAREGYEHVEHMKRFTTHGMATDQGRIGGLVGSAVLADARGVPLSQVGQANPRPYVRPVPFAALAGGEVREHFKPKRRLPLHDWHESAGATFVNAGIWLRPLVYSKQSGWEPVLREARAVRQSVGITDVSTLGKIDVQGPDAARFLDLAYANTFSTLAVGRARYGIMLREDGMLLDDGTTSRLDTQHFLVTTTTVNHVAVLEHMEFHLQTAFSHLDVILTDVADQWAQFAVAGPRSREVISRVVGDLDVSNQAFPFMAAGEASIAGIPGRLFRISFSGELAYELAVPARHALTAWKALLEAGQSFGITPYGLDALNTLRIEKGHVTSAELNGNTGAHDLGFARMLKKRGDFIGGALSHRVARSAKGRLQLVGVRPLDPTRRLRNGSHLVQPRERAASLGYITSSTPSVELEGWVGLALLAGGRKRVGEKLLAVSPVHDESLEVEIVSPHMVDPENRRVRQ